MEANSAWPTDSGLIFGYLRRADNLLRVQAKCTGVACESKLVERWLTELERAHKTIQMLPSRPGSAAERRRLYRSLLKTAAKTEGKIRELLDRRLPEIRSCCILPSLRLRADRIVEELNRALDDAGRTAAVARRRVLQGETVAAEDKAFSLAVPDAYMICKGGAKGRAVLGEQLWNAPEHQLMRRDRSAVESSIFMLKHHCNLRRFCRHGLDGVRKDLSEATLAYNLWRMAFVRARKREEGPPVAAAA